MIFSHHHFVNAIHGEPITGYVDRFTDENSSCQSKHFSLFSDPKAQEEPCEEANECIYDVVSA